MTSLSPPPHHRPTRRPDYARIPAAALGNPLDAWEGERWLDVRSPQILALIRHRLDDAFRLACDDPR